MESPEKVADWTEDEKRADIYVRHFYSQGKPTLMDTRILDPNAASYRKKPVEAVI